MWHFRCLARGLINSPLVSFSQNELGSAWGTTHIGWLLGSLRGEPSGKERLGRRQGQVGVIPGQPQGLGHSFSPAPSPGKCSPRRHGVEGGLLRPSSSPGSPQPPQPLNFGLGPRSWLFLPRNPPPEFRVSTEMSAPGKGLWPPLTLGTTAELSCFGAFCLRACLRTDCLPYRSVWPWPAGAPSSTQSQAREWLRNDLLNN